MSLLMEALKKAEEAKRLIGESNVPAAGYAAKTELTLTPITPSSTNSTSTLSTTPSGSPLPDLSLHTDSVDADLAAVSMEEPVKQPASASRTANTKRSEAAERTAVHNVFAAKQPTTKPRTGFWLLVVLGGCAALCFCGYFWWQLHIVSSESLVRSNQSPLFAQSQPPADTPVQGSASTALTSAKPFPEKKTTILSVPMITPEPETAPSIKHPARQQKPSTSAILASPDRPIQLTRNQLKSSQALEQAYESLLAGRLEEAQHGYEQILRGDEKNTDALLGLATLAARQGQIEWAQAYYLRALESDPNNAVAQAGLINTKGQADSGLSESRLKTALTSQPDSPALHFALGNLYAHQNRWSEAQQAYFRAYSTEPDNPDFIFNLAVSLDHLHQNKLAIQYYQMALNIARANGISRSFSFDEIQVKNRIFELQP